MVSYEFGEAFQRHSLAVLCRIPGGVLRYRSALDHTYYGSDALRTISEVLFAHVDEHGKLPQQPTLLEEVKDHVSEDDFKSVARTLERLYKEDVSDAKAVLLKLIEFGKQQALINATLKAADKLDRGERDLRPLFDEAALVGEDLLDIGVDYKGDVQDRLDRYLDPSLQDEDLIRTGIPHLDAMLGGGLGRGELGVFLAPPKRGKSTTLINVGFGALTAVNRYNVAHYSMEMNQNKVSGRYDDRLMGERVKYKKTDVERYAKGVEQRLGRVVRGRLFVKDYPTRGATVSKIRSHLSLLSARGFHPDMIVVDYADIMKAERRMGEMRHEQAGIYEDLRQLAGECNAAMWTGSQASRGALEKDTITIEDFAEAFEKAAIVDAAIAFCLQRDQGVKTADGTQKMVDIRMKVLRGELVEVLSHNFQTGADEWKRVTESFHNGQAPVNGFVRVRTEVTGRSKGSVTTPDHAYFLEGGSKVRASDLRMGDEIVGCGYVLSENQRQVVLGTLLGDGSLRADGTLAIEHGSVQDYYLDWKRKVFRGLSSSVTKIERSEGVIAGCLLKARTSRLLTVRGSHEIARLREVFYPEAGAKVVSQEILDSLTELGLAVWFMDDGSFAKRECRVTLHTNGFDEISTERVLAWFRSCWDADGTILESGAIQFCAKATRRLSKVLSPYLVEDHRTPRVTKRFLRPDVVVGRKQMCAVRVWSVESADYVNRDRLDMTVEDNHNFYLASGVLVSNCQTNDERMQHRCRLYGAALRNQEDGRTVECEILRDRCRLRSIALYDVAGTQITVDGIDDKREDYADPVKDNKAVRKKAAKRLKDKAGLTRKKSSKKVYKRSKKKTGKKVARRRSDRITHKVQMEDDE